MEYMESGLDKLHYDETRMILEVFINEYLRKGNIRTFLANLVHKRDPLSRCLICIFDLDARNCRVEEIQVGTKWYSAFSLERQAQGIATTQNHLIQCTVSSISSKSTSEVILAPTELCVPFVLHYDKTKIYQSLSERLEHILDDAHSVVVGLEGEWRREPATLVRYPIPTRLPSSITQLEEFVAGIFDYERFFSRLRILGDIAERGNGLVVVDIRGGASICCVAHYLGPDTDQFRQLRGHDIVRHALGTQGTTQGLLGLLYCIVVQVGTWKYRPLVDWVFGFRHICDNPIKELYTRFDAEMKTGSVGIFFGLGGKGGVTRTRYGVEQLEPVYTF